MTLNFNVGLRPFKFIQTTRSREASCQGSNHITIMVDCRGDSTTGRGHVQHVLNYGERLGRNRCTVASDQIPMHAFGGVPMTMTMTAITVHSGRKRHCRVMGISSRSMRLEFDLGSGALDQFVPSWPAAWKLVQVQAAVCSHLRGASGGSQGHHMKAFALLVRCPRLPPILPFPSEFPFSLTICPGRSPNIGVAYGTVILYCAPLLEGWGCCDGSSSTIRHNTFIGRGAAPQGGQASRQLRCVRFCCFASTAAIGPRSLQP